MSLGLRRKRPASNPAATTTCRADHPARAAAAERRDPRPVVDPGAAAPNPPEQPVRQRIRVHACAALREKAPWPVDAEAALELPGRDVPRGEPDAPTVPPLAT